MKDIIKQEAHNQNPYGVSTDPDTLLVVFGASPKQILF